VTVTATATATATAAPFRALRFQTERVGELGEVLAPPYDVITPQGAAMLRARHPSNIVRITNPSGEGDDLYVRAARELESWLADGSLVRDDKPAVYVHRHAFTKEETAYTRTGVWMLVRLADFGEGAVVPHERTMKGPKADRLALMRACRAQLSPIFFICSDPKGEIEDLLGKLVKGEPAERAEFPAGEVHEVWRVDEHRWIELLVSTVQEQTLLIADGHHRYETGLAYRDELIAAGAPRTGWGSHEYVLAHVVPETDSGLLLLPTHRTVGGEPLDWISAVRESSDRFEVVKLSEADLDSVTALLENERGRPVFVLVVRGEEGGRLLRLRDPTFLSTISSVALHDIFLADGVALTSEEQIERVSYCKDASEAVAEVRSGRAQAAVLLAAADVPQVRAAAAAGERLPAKTTYFWPKVPTGVAIHAIDPLEDVERAAEA
jgi:uncharacterized protein (DUF1015 family)